ncbi:dGTP triphosphohydrolase [Aquirufa antheringensis]|uniref:dGTP triphosphohydrolase n=1 Tax=Aquirufa antheringensis TaxID=2516559 RepID=UPI0022A85B3D|nr:dNTP triphosphohydrolase [Aquirufa antheringensis]MCZ2486938.1 dNTP triphosphohydrolase [Aquirufa antheringensis]
MENLLNNCYSHQRDELPFKSDVSDPRTEFQRDFDRIIFSSAFRRLQNKTQVFPLPGSVFVHNRLTHSLEVASVGRSLGSLVGYVIENKYKKELSKESINFYKYNLYNVIASACLCHDIGNPAFGHSGEDAIASFFKKNEPQLKLNFTNEEWSDLINFEGNANAIRVLTQHQKDKSNGGLKLTYSTLSAIAKYPCESSGKNPKILHRKKFGFFQSEKHTFESIALNTQMVKEESNPLIYKRHPFVWLVEAADDICYNIIDFEDAHRLGIIENTKCIDLLKYLIECIGIDDHNKINTQLGKIKDKNEKVAYLRAKSINALTLKAKSIFEDKIELFFTGKINASIFDLIKNDCDALIQIKNFSVEHIYNNRHVVEIENAGYNVMYELLSHFIPPILRQENQRTESEKKAVKLLPLTFNYENESDYTKVLGVLDYISGMTDNYATDLYKRIKGIEIGMKF